MRLFKGTLFVLFSAVIMPLTVAQTIPAGTFKHIIIIVQENRTPDNLFGAWAGEPCPINQTPMPATP